MKTNRKRSLSIIILLLLILFLCLVPIFFAGNHVQPVTYSDFYFNTVVSVTFYNEKNSTLAKECFEICDIYEIMFSRTTEESDVWRINHSNGEPVSVSEDTYLLIQEALYYCELTEGKIDITVAPLMDLWAFTDSSSTKTLPSSAEIDALLPHVDYHNVVLGPNNTVTLKDPEAAIDLGFIAKGYVADKLKEYLISQGVTSAIINLGGNVCVIGNKPDGTPYTIGVQEPFASTGTTLTTVQITDISAVTSGTYQRYFEYDNTVYHHILNAKTGYPMDNHLSGVTILCPSATTADALSTTCFIMGEETALEYIHTMNNTECILIKENGEVIYSYCLP